MIVDEHAAKLKKLPKYHFRYYNILYEHPRIFKEDHKGKIVKAESYRP